MHTDIYIDTLIYIFYLTHLQKTTLKALDSLFYTQNLCSGWKVLSLTKKGITKSHETYISPNQSGVRHTKHIISLISLKKN